MNQIPIYITSAQNSAELEKRITSHRIAPKALTATDAKHCTLLQSANSIILRCDTQGHITFFNDFAQKFLGFRDDEVLGKSIIGTIVPEEDSAGRDMADLIQNLTQSPEQYLTHENENVCKNGERVWVSWTNKALRDEDKRIFEILCVGNDITERKSMENALRQREKELAEKSQHLEAVNQALTALLDHREVEKRSIAESILISMEKLVFPYLHKLEKAELNADCKTYIDIIKSNLQDIFSPQSKTITAKYMLLTPTEIQVADFIRQGKSSKQISATMSVSISSISFHRNNIRKKLGLLNQAINLRTYLQGLPG